jgi:hypothetical protein
MNWKSGTRGSGALLSLACIASLLGGGVCQAATITYNVDLTVGSGSIVGTIETNGTTSGSLTTGDFVAWDLTLNGVGASYTIKSSDGDAFNGVTGADVTATAKDLFFNFTGSDGGYLLFQDGAYSGSHYYCDATSAATCLVGISDVPGYFTDSSAQYNHEASGNQIIGVAATPLPSTWTMLIAGFIGLGFFAYRGSKKGIAGLSPA